MKKFRINMKIIRLFVLAFLIVTLYSFFISDLKPIQFLRFKITDAFYILKYNLKPLPEEINKIAVLAIDDESFSKLQLRWPWPRGFIADIVKKVSSQKPDVICVDLDFTKESADKSQDVLLANAFENAGNVIIASRFGKDGKYHIPIEALHASSFSFGFVNKPADVDNVTRHIAPIALSSNKDIIDYSLSLKAACRFWGIPLGSVGYKDSIVSIRHNNIIYGNLHLNDDGTAWVNYNAGTEDFNVIPVWKLIKGEIREDALKNKIVFLGITAEVFHDVYYTPFKVMPAVLMDANETLMYLSQGFIREMPFLWQYAILFFLVLIILLSVYLLDIRRASISLILEVILFLSLSISLFLQNTMLDFFGALFLIVSTFLGFYVYENIALLLQNVRLKNEAVRDGLTRFYIFKFFELKLKNEFENATRENRNLALIIVDVDNFKRINDTYGHTHGNVVLTSVSDAMRRRSRRHDILARFTGTSFCAYMADAGFHDALRYAEHLRKEIEGLEFVATKGEKIKITISAGIATIKCFPCRNYTDLIKAADAALYRAKHTGKNKICLFDKNLDVIED